MKTIAIAASAVVMWVAVGMAGAEELQVPGKATTAPTVKKQALCPVMGGPVNTNVYADANGKRVYFCCGGCPETFKKNPEKYIRKMEAEGITLDKAPQAAPTDAPSAGPRETKAPRP
jgi:YHS domain-containing protein